MHRDTKLFEEVCNLLSSAENFPLRRPEEYRPGPGYTELLARIKVTQNWEAGTIALAFYPGRGPAREAYRRAVLQSLVQNPNLTSEGLLGIVGEDTLHPDVLAGLLAHPSCTKEVLALLHAAEADELVIRHDTRALLTAADPELARRAHVLQEAGWGRWRQFADALLSLADHPLETTEIFLGLVWGWSGTTQEAVRAAVDLTSAPSR